MRIIRIFHSLHFKIASGVIGTVLLISTIYFVSEYRAFKEQLYSEVQESARDVSNVTLNSLLELSMLGEHPELLQRAVVNLTENSSVETIHIIGQNGTTRFSSQPDTVGVLKQDQDAGCRDCHLQEDHLPRSAFLEIENRSILRHASPIPNRKECQSCHDPEQRLLGVLLVDFPTDQLQAELKANLMDKMSKAGLTVFAILVVLGVLLNRIVIRRVKKLTKATGEMIVASPRSPDLSALVSQDEIGQLAKSFHDMSKNLGRYCSQLEQKEAARVQLLERLIHSQEEERRNLSRELHDQLGQSLSALLLALKSACRNKNGSTTMDSESYFGLETRIKKLIDEVHHLAWQMRPSILDDYGLEKALQRYIEELSKSSSLRVDYQSHSPSRRGRLPGWLEITLYRIAQEALTNVVRHSGASQASLILMRSCSSVTLLIEDNGNGFDLQSVESGPERGLGLLGMRERVSQCGGTLDIESGHLKGTTIRVKVQLQEEPEWQSKP